MGQYTLVYSVGDRKGELYYPLIVSNSPQEMADVARGHNGWLKVQGLKGRVKAKRVEDGSSETVNVGNDGDGLGPDPYHTGTKFTIKVPINGLEWRKRERDRQVEAGVRLPWGVTAEWHDSKYRGLHYPRPSSKKPGMLVYTPTEEYGHDDRQLVVRPGTYLHRTFGDVWDDQYIETLAAEFIVNHKNTEVKFATTEDEIRDVYQIGPRSCMGGGGEDFNGHDHPCITYAYGDLAVAYIEKDDGVIARCVVWPDKKIMTVVYGSSLLGAALGQDGYTAGDLYGARLSKIADDYGERGQYLVPYIDTRGGIVDRGDHFQIVNSQERYDIAIDSTCGTASLEGTCILCGRFVRWGQMSDGICDSCRDNCNTCDRCSNLALETVPVFIDVALQEEWCRNCWEWNSVSCTSCSNRSVLPVAEPGDPCYSCRTTAGNAG